MRHCLCVTASAASFAAIAAIASARSVATAADTRFFSVAVTI